MPGGASTAMRTRRHVVSSTRTVTPVPMRTTSPNLRIRTRMASLGATSKVCFVMVRQWSPRNRLEALGRVEWIAKGHSKASARLHVEKRPSMRAFAGLQSCSSATRARLCGLWVVVQAKSLARKPSTR